MLSAVTSPDYNEIIYRVLACINYFKVLVLELPELDKMEFLPMLVVRCSLMMIYD